jgi:hypothetical protein
LCEYTHSLTSNRTIQSTWVATLEVVEAKKADDIEEAKELEDSKAEETGTQVIRVPNNPR